MRVPLLAAMLLAGCAAPLATDRPEATVAFDAIRIETDLGAFTAIMWPHETPETVAFMRGLIESGYYDGRAFGRVIPGFVIQEVDRTGGTTDQPDKVGLEAPTSVMFSAGAFGIARDADPDSGSSEFFVMDFATSRLYGNYTAYAQVVDGIDVVHAIARVPAVKTGPASAVASPAGFPVYFGVHDRVPVEPVVMRKVTMATVELPADVAARYPLQVGETYATDTLRATLEWPADLAPGRASTLTWYVSARDASPQGQVQDPAPVALDGASIRFDGAGEGTVGFVEDPAAPGKLVLTWAPPAAGSYQFHLERDGAELAIANLTFEAR